MAKPGRVRPRSRCGAGGAGRVAGADAAGRGWWGDRGWGDRGDGGEAALVGFDEDVAARGPGRGARPGRRASGGRSWAREAGSEGGLGRAGRRGPRARRRARGPRLRNPPARHVRRASARPRWGCGRRAWRSGCGRPGSRRRGPPRWAALGRSSRPRPTRRRSGPAGRASKRTGGVYDSGRTVSITPCSVPDFSAAERTVVTVFCNVSSSGARASSQALTAADTPLTPPGSAITLLIVAREPCCSAAWRAASTVLAYGSIGSLRSASRRCPRGRGAR